VCESTPMRRQNYFALQKVNTGCWTYTFSYLVGVAASVLAVKAAMA